MQEARQTRAWTLVAVMAMAVSAGYLSVRRLESRMAAPLAAEEVLRDAVASPPVAAGAGMPGRSAASLWFKAPSGAQADADQALMSSRRRRASARAVAFQ